MHEGQNGGCKPTEGQRALDELRSLLFGQEKSELLTLQARLNNLEVRAKDVSEVVAEALRLRAASDVNGELSHALAPPIEHALRESVCKNPQALAGALYPIMGPAIRKSMYEAIRALIESFNQALAQGLSLRGIKWRIEAWRTGRPFAEVVLMHTLVFRVEQTFLIHKETGVLLHHLAMSSLGVQDPDLVSGMLSAIQDFMRVSFNASRGDSVNTLQVGDLQVWVEQGPEAILASVIRGHAPQRVRFKLKERLEQIHAKFGAALNAFDGNTLPFLLATEILADCLESQMDENQSFRNRKYVTALAVGVVGLFLVWGVSSLVQGRRWSKFVEKLGNEPGIVVTSFSKRGGRYRIHGLRDPRSANPVALLESAGLNGADAEFEWRPYFALDDPLVLEQAAAILQPPPGVSLSLRDGALLVSGEGDAAWAERTRSFALFIPGVRKLDDTQLVVWGPLGREKKALESIAILFPVGSPIIQDSQQSRVDEVVQIVRSLIARAGELHSKVVIEVLGRTDSTGTETENWQLSELRARNVMQLLQQANVPRNLLRPKSLATSEPVRVERTEADRQFNRSVTFRVRLQEQQRSVGVL